MGVWYLQKREWSSILFLIPKTSSRVDDAATNARKSYGKVEVEMERLNAGPVHCEGIRRRGLVLGVLIGEVRIACGVVVGDVHLVNPPLRL